MCLTKHCTSCGKILVSTISSIKTGHKESCANIGDHKNQLKNRNNV